MENTNVENIENEKLNDTEVKNLEIQENKTLKISETKPYNYGLDIIRILAMFFVVLVHSTSFYGFLDEGISSFSMFLVGIGRYVSYTCVPLFILLTGYLNYNKEPTKKYYFKIFRILFEFVLCAVVVAVFNRVVLNDTTPVLDIIVNVVEFKFPAYSWYINMFVGLFLLIPFLNYLFKSIPQNKKWLFIIILIVVFGNPQISSYWFIGYPLMYYFIGCMLREKQLKFNKFYLFLFILALSMLQVLFSVYSVIPGYVPENYTNLGCIFIAFSIFLMFYDLKIKNPTKVKNFFCKFGRIVANTSMATFLVSVIFESLTAQMFTNLSLITFVSRLPYLIYLTPLKFILSVAIGIIINLVVNLFFKLIKVIIKKK